MAKYSRRYRRSRSPGRLWRYLLAFGAAVVIGIVRYWPADVPERVAGAARVVDGDSLRIGGDRIRLVGIDAPEGQQECARDGQPWRCGARATQALRELVKRRAVTCDVEDVDKYDRLLAVCTVGGVELNAWMVREGHAVAYGRYLTEEKAARRARRGLWSGTFQRPKSWRDENLTGALAAVAS